MIYIVTHNDENYIPKLDNYKEIKVGKIYEDDGRDNINHLNPYINEATAIYDLWKNCDDEIIGLYHYKRMFICKNKFEEITALSYNKAEVFLKDSGLICTRPSTLGRNTIYNYLKYTFTIESPHVIPILEKYINKLEEIDPNIVKYFKLANGFISRNMFVAKKEILDEYCNWLFPFIIPLTEEFVDNDLQRVKAINGFKGQERLIGHLIERIFSYWIENKYTGEITFLPYIVFED